ncbi:MAG: hydrogenase maturation nickel metallochaperone HypA [Bacteroidota bacterium]|nr:hydrogenase maturation nickel metallochaperone HypA [Bacteroidota bacterium]
MHELSIAEHIVEIALEHLPAHDGATVKEIVLEIGTLSGIEIDALTFAMDVVMKNTALENASLRIERVQGRARCDSCTEEFDLEDYYSPCPSCGGFESTVLRGEEMRVKSMLVEERKKE